MPTDIRRIFLIGSGKGGVGKSTVAAHLAVRLARKSYRVGLFDADCHAPSIPTILGSGERATVERGRLRPIEHQGVRVLSIGMLVEPTFGVRWHGPVLRGALHQMYADAAWGELDVLFVDLPPGAGEIHDTILQCRQATGALLVTTPESVALSVLKRTASVFIKAGVRISAVVENMSHRICPHCGESVPIFCGNAGACLASELNVDTLITLPFCVRSGCEAASDGQLFYPEADENVQFFTGMDRLVDRLLRDDL